MFRMHSSLHKLNIGSGALPDLMLDLGILKIILVGVFFLFPIWGSNSAGPYPHPFPNPAGQS